MSLTTDLVDECPLDGDGAGWVRVFYCHDLVSMVGYGEKLDLRCREALKLFDWLLQHHAFLVDRASNSYDCRECGLTHHRSVSVCPTLVQREA
jgi:hypothetical protein